MKTQTNRYASYYTSWSGFSSRALTSFVPDRYKANGGAELVPKVITYREYGNEEWANSAGLEMYKTSRRGGQVYRSYNAQNLSREAKRIGIGRFMQGDPKMEATVSMRGYVFSGNNQVMFTDLLGDQMDPGHYGNTPPPFYFRSNFFSYMDRNGNKWHHRDFMAGTGAEGIPYTEGWGSDGFGDMSNNGLGSGDRGRGMFGNGPYAGFWEGLWNKTPENGAVTYGDVTSFDFLRPYTYANLTGIFNTDTYHDDVYNDPEIGQRFVLTAFKGEILEASWYEWDGPMFRALTPDFISVGVGFNGIVGIGAGTSIEFNWVLHGPEASWKPALTATQSIGGGYSVDATINIGTSRYSGNPRRILRQMLVTNSLGDRNVPTIWGSAGITEIGKIGITGSFTYLGSKEFIYGGQINIGAGLPAGIIPVNGAIGLSNTWILYDFYKK